MFNTHISRHPTYLNLHLIPCKALGFLNLHRIYRNLQKFTPLFEPFTKMYVIYSVNWICPPPPHYSPACFIRPFSLFPVFPSQLLLAFLALLHRFHYTVGTQVGSLMMGTLPILTIRGTLIPALGVLNFVLAKVFRKHPNKSCEFIP